MWDLCLQLAVEPERTAAPSFRRASKFYADFDHTEQKIDTFNWAQRGRREFPTLYCKTKQKERIGNMGRATNNRLDWVLGNLINAAGGAWGDRMSGCLKDLEGASVLNLP